MKNGRNMD